MIRRDCVHYHCEHDMGASIDCCTLRGLDNCPCSNDCNDYANKNEIYLLGLEVFKKRKEAKNIQAEKYLRKGADVDEVYSWQSDQG